MSITQSHFGTKGNFEALILEGSQLVHYWRHNDDHVFPWYRSVEFASNVDSEAAFIQSNFGNRGNFEVVCRKGNKLRHYWRDNDTPGYPWHQGFLFSDHITSSPFFIQGNFGRTC